MLDKGAYILIIQRHRIVQHDVTHNRASTLQPLCRIAELGASKEEKIHPAWVQDNSQHGVGGTLGRGESDRKARVPVSDQLDSAGQLFPKLCESTARDACYSGRVGVDERIKLLDC